MTPSRAQRLDAFRQNERNTVLIVGAGINGAGLFRDLAHQGIKVALIDRGDFCSGTSAAPSRLIHGGLKYLETGEFRLVAESALERNLLLKNAPHYVKPLRTTLPITSWLGGIVPSIRRFLGQSVKISDRGVVITKLGMALYDFFGRHHRSMPTHKLALRRSSQASLPDIRRDVLATATYYDAAVSQPERLNFELIDDTLRESPHATAVNYLSLESRQGSRIELRDILTGNCFSLEADIVVNAGGAWIDRINSNLGLSTCYIGGTKGSHLILDNPRLCEQLGGRMVYFGTDDGRICLAYPYLGNVLVGSTDLPCSDPDEAVCEEDEVDYMLDAVQGLFPTLAVNKSQVLYRYCGVRPLPASDASEPGAVSRDHSIREDRLDDGPRLLSLVGGKWTTFRGFSEEATDRVLELLSSPRRANTRELPIGGGKNYPKSIEERDAWCKTTAQTYSIAVARAEQLLERYGSHGSSVAEWCTQQPDQALKSLPDYTEQEFIRLCEQECVGTLPDILFRRLPIALSGQLTESVIREVATIVGGHLNWSDTDKEHAIDGVTIKL